ncbi:MAG TPA: nucleoside-diphosphate sugar epimerase/dehydratase [Gemmataceae bacterium]|nr:nucleoside-diphosphate sugar epimerase/dehydratase [Gemmataceae bacterium]
MMIRARGMRQVIEVGIDAAMLAFAFIGAFLLRFEGNVPGIFIDVMLTYLPIVVALKMIVLWCAGQFKPSWRYVNLSDALGLLAWLSAITAWLLVWAGVRDWLPWTWAKHPALVLPIGVVLIDLILSLLAMVGVRALTRLIFEKNERRAMAANSADRVPTLLYGAGRAGALVAKELRNRPDSGIELVGFLDDDHHLHGMHVEGRPVLGGADDLKLITQKYGVRQVIITIASAQEKATPRIARLCEAEGLRTKVLPPLHEIVQGTFNLSKLREVSIEDLLRRSPIQLDIGEVQKIIKKQVVLVTGAGGSIGSELCRIIARLEPATLVLVDQAENNLFHIHMALVDDFPNLHVVPCIADICDEQRMDAIFAEWRPPIVFHAAAHKHVPMMEWNPGEAVKNNVIGTRTIAMLADAWNVERFVMISTDKAVNPTSVMGVSKRVAELYIQSIAQKSSTLFMTVRFGNVLGSAGSVIPIFQKQIAAGGPVTVTHPEMKRYFMTIPEACQLVLQAATMGKGGELFILDMGEPVKIYDLACDLIRLSGLMPHDDVPIRYTGLRPGEKLFEELSLGEEQALKTRHPRIFIGQVKAPEYAWISEMIEDLNEKALTANAATIVGKFKQVVPEYQSTVTRQDASAKSVFRGPHAHGAPAASS